MAIIIFNRRLVLLFALPVSLAVFYRWDFLSSSQGIQSSTNEFSSCTEDFLQKIKREIKSGEILEILKKESNDSQNSHHDMFVLFVMSHGKSGQISGSDDKMVKTKDILDQFNANNCPSLIGKPKLFFIQACRGDLKSVGVFPKQSKTTGTDALPDTSKHPIKDPEILDNLKREDDLSLSLSLQPLNYESESDSGTTHERADQALAYATVDGQQSWRGEESGSFFIQHVVQVFKEKAHREDFLSMMSMVLRRLNQGVMGDGNKQIGEIRHTLLKKVYLLP